jgi:nitroreductase
MIRTSTSSPATPLSDLRLDPGERHQSEVDCAIAMATAELLLREKGLATCWGGFVTRLVAGAPELRAFAGIPEDAKLCCTLMVGIPDEHYEGIPARPAAEIVWRTDATF